MKTFNSGDDKPLTSRHGPGSRSFPTERVDNKGDNGTGQYSSNQFQLISHVIIGRYDGYNESHARESEDIFTNNNELNKDQENILL